MSTLADAARAFLGKCRCDGTGKVLGHPSDHHADAVDCEDCAELRAALSAHDAAKADAPTQGNRETARGLAKRITADAIVAAGDADDFDDTAWPQFENIVTEAIAAALATAREDERKKIADEFYNFYLHIFPHVMRPSAAAGAERGGKG